MYSNYEPRECANRISEAYTIQHYHVFEKGVFESNPSLFERFNNHIADNIRSRYSYIKETLSKYVDSITWPIVKGIGFCGATHPGAEKIFSTIMRGSYVVHNSDCIYINPFDQVFAISDAPDMSTYSRALLTKIDEHLKRGYHDLEGIIADSVKKITAHDHATLSLLCFPKNKEGRKLVALAFVAGDTYIFHGNIARRRLAHIDGEPQFIGKTLKHCQPQYFDLEESDFFIIASDGVLSARSNSEKPIQDTLWDYLDPRDLHESVSNIVRGCNLISEEMVDSRVINRFRGGDDISVLVIYPEQLADIECRRTILMGGWIRSLEHWKE
ncbi:hypothetical protein ACFLWX_04680 [Chloroflexota bacterium]